MNMNKSRKISFPLSLEHFRRHRLHVFKRKEQRMKLYRLYFQAILALKSCLCDSTLACSNLYKTHEKYYLVIQIMHFIIFL